MTKKNITFRIDEKLIEKLNELRGNRSQNEILTEFLTSWSGKSTSTSTSNEVALQLQLLVQAQAKLQAQVQLLVQLQAKTHPVDDETGDIYIDETPDWQNEDVAPEAFYGKVTTYEKGEFDHDPLKYLDIDTKQKTAADLKIKEEEDERPW